MVDQTLRERLLDGETVVGPFQSIASPFLTEIIGHAGYDFTILDQEHGPLTAAGCKGLCAAAENVGMTPIIRVRNASEGEIQRALDIGGGVEIPQIETLADAEAAVAASRFDPLGSRGLSPYVRAADYDGGDDYTARQNHDRTVIVHVEGKRAVENAEEILQVDGIDVVFLGPYDLSQSLGIPGQVRDERVESRMEHVCELAADADAVVGTYADDPGMADRWIDAGVQFLALSVDAPIIRRRFEALRGELSV
jgi:4-hydroxy-2-oxoheptanedioate aldolase